MNNTFGKRILWSAVAAVAVTALGYWADSDPSYPNVWDTVKEFLVLSFLMLFPAILGVSWLVARARRSKT